MHPAGNTRVFFRYLFKFDIRIIIPAAVHSRIRHRPQIRFQIPVIIRPRRLRNIIVFIGFLRFRHILGVSFSVLLDGLLCLIVLRFLLRCHIPVKIHGFYHVLQIPGRILHILRRAGSVIDHAALLRRLIQNIVEPAHRLVDGIHHAVRPLHRPIRQKGSVVERPVRKSPDHRKSF